jgi:hypothetical protein
VTGVWSQGEKFEELKVNITDAIQVILASIYDAEGEGKEENIKKVVFIAAAVVITLGTVIADSIEAEWLWMVTA